MWSNKLKSLNQPMKQKGMTWVENECIELMNHFEAKQEIKCTLKAGTLRKGLWVFYRFAFPNAETKCAGW